MSTNDSPQALRPPDRSEPFDLRELRTPNQLVHEYPDIISEHALRWALRFRHTNGLDAHVTRLGKNLLIHVPGFTSWLMKQGAR